MGSIKLNKPRARRGGFTLVELCAVMAVVALIGLMMVPALARTRPNTQVTQCLNNARQMALAVQMYTADYHDLYPPNPDDGGNSVGYQWCLGNVQGGMAVDATPLGNSTFNPDVLTNVSSTLVAPYLNGNAAILSCPTDPRIGTYQGTNTSLRGQKVHAARSISMNQGVGTADPGWLTADGAGGGSHSGVPNLPVPSGWLAGSLHVNTHDNPWATFGSTSDFRVVKPSQIFLMTDEDPYSINDSTLGVSAGQREFVDYPASWHNRSGTFSFCDGHVELHRWVGNLIILNAPAFTTTPTAAPDVADWTWLWQHATVKMK